MFFQRNNKKVNDVYFNLYTHVKIWMWSVPKSGELRSKWITEIEKYSEFDYQKVKFMVCCEHFEPGCIKNTKRNVLRKDSVPTIFSAQSDT